MDAKFIYWLLQKTSDLPGDDNWLSENERALLQKMKFPKRRGEWRLGRLTAKRLVASYLKTSHGEQYNFPEIEIFPSASGAPKALLRSKSPSFGISISHRVDIGFCVLQPQKLPIGCDLEIIELRSHAFIRDYFTTNEYSRVMAARKRDQALFANLIWSAKESVLKSIEQGLKSDTRNVEINIESLQSSKQWKRLSAVSVESRQDFYGWWRLDGSYILTVFSAEPTEEPMQIQMS
jgi:4'-phosphopantetheinyl transferase